MAFERTNPERTAVRLTGNPMATVPQTNFSAAGAIQSLGAQFSDLGNQLSSWGEDKMRVQSQERAEELGYGAELQYDPATGIWSAPATPFKGGYRTVAQANAILNTRLATMNEQSLDAQLDEIALANWNNPEGYYNSAEAAIAGFTAGLKPEIAGRIQGSVFNKMQARGSAIEQKSQEINLKAEYEGMEAAFNDYTEKLFDATMFGDERLIGEAQAKAEGLFYKMVEANLIVIPNGSTPEAEITKRLTTIRIMGDMYRDINEDLTTGVATEDELAGLVTQLEGLERAASGVESPKGMPVWGNWDAATLAEIIPDPKLREALALKVGKIANAYTMSKSEDGKANALNWIDKAGTEAYKNGTSIYFGQTWRGFTESQQKYALDQLFNKLNNGAERASPTAVSRFYGLTGQLPPSLIGALKETGPGANPDQIRDLAEVIRGSASALAGNDSLVDAKSEILSGLEAKDRKFWGFLTTRLEMESFELALENTQKAAENNWGGGLERLVEIYNSTQENQTDKVGNAQTLINKTLNDEMGQDEGWIWGESTRPPIGIYDRVSDQIRTEVETEFAINGSNLEATEIKDMIARIGKRVRAQWQEDTYAPGGWSHKSEVIPGVRSLDDDGEDRSWLKAMEPGLQTIIANDVDERITQQLEALNIKPEDLSVGEEITFKPVPGKAGLYQVVIGTEANGQPLNMQLRRSNGDPLLVDINEAYGWAAHQVDEALQAKVGSMRWTDQGLVRGEQVNPFIGTEGLDGLTIPGNMDGESLVEWAMQNRMGLKEGQLQEILEWYYNGAEMRRPDGALSNDKILSPVPEDVFDPTVTSDPIVGPNSDAVPVPTKYRGLSIHRPDIGTQVAAIIKEAEVADNIPDIEAVNWEGLFDEDESEFKASLQYASSGITWDNPVGYRSARQNTFTAKGNYVPDVVQAVKAIAPEFGIDPKHFLQLSLYETIGSLNPYIAGGGTKDGKRGQFLGLIQMGPTEQKKYGYYSGMPIEQAVRASMKFLKDRGYDANNYASDQEKLNRMYRTVIGGNPNAPLSRSDINGTIGSHLGKLHAYRDEAARLMGEKFEAINPSKVQMVAKNGKAWQPNVKPQVVNLATKSWAEAGLDRMIINSGFRDPGHNDAVGGATHSQHMSANALDISTRGMSRDQILNLIRIFSKNGAGGIGVYANAIHIDIGSPRFWGPDYKSRSAPSWARPYLNMHVQGLFRKGRNA